MFMEHAHTPPPAAPTLVDRDEEHLRLLANYHFLVAGISALALLVFVVLPLVLGPAYLAVLGVPKNQPEAQLQQQLLAGLTLGGFMTLIYARNGLALKGKRYRISCIILSAAECLSFPLGMILGVSAILVLRRDSVRALFAANKPKPLS